MRSSSNANTDVEVCHDSVVIGPALQHLTLNEIEHLEDAQHHFKQLKVTANYVRYIVLKYNKQLSVHRSICFWY